MPTVETFEELDVWQNAMSLCKAVYTLTNSTEIKSDFPLRDQLRKSAISIPSNIAEGFERESNNQFIYFLIIAKGSCGELRTQLNLAYNLGLLGEEAFHELKDKCVTISKQLSSFIKYLRTTKRTELSKPSKLSKPS
jgi:four helix bundle protein